MIDNDDCIRLRKLIRQYNSVTECMNNAINDWVLEEVKLNEAIANFNIDVKMSWKKQVIELTRKHPEFLGVQTKYYHNKRGEKTAKNTLKALENEINILKKTYEITPK